jgi:putative tricarboxylic transport membrane protein
MSVLCGFGLLGYVMRKNRHPLAPVIPGGRIEEALPQSIIISQGDPAALLMRPIVIFFLLMALGFLMLPYLFRRSSRAQVPVVEQ